LKNNIKNKNEKMSIDLYTISEIFSKYQDLALLWKQTGKLQYKVCFNVNHMAQLAISRNEFYKSCLSGNQMEVLKEIIVFSTKDDDTIFAIKHHKGIFNNQIFHSIRINLSERRKCGYTRFDDRTSQNLSDWVVEHNTSEKILQKYIQKKVHPWNNLPGSFRDPLFKVFFDVKTTYEILQTREACTEKIKNYAKEKTLEQFNKLVTLFSNKNVASCDLYIGLNARLLDINVEKIVSQYRDKRLQLAVAASNITDIINSW
jgi:hypothetical protein